MQKNDNTSQSDLHTHCKLYKNSSRLLCRIDSLVHRVMWKCKGPIITKTILKKEHKTGVYTLPHFKAYYEVTVIKTVWGKKKRQCGTGIKIGMDEWDRLKDPEIYP